MPGLSRVSRDEYGFAGECTFPPGALSGQGPPDPDPSGPVRLLWAHGWLLRAAAGCAPGTRGHLRADGGGGSPQPRWALKFSGLPTSLPDSPSPASGPSPMGQAGAVTRPGRMGCASEASADRSPGPAPPSTCLWGEEANPRFSVKPRSKAPHGPRSWRPPAAQDPLPRRRSGRETGG